tara:strand:+ start:2714 stop:4669 length:1956 start_codon:yes stop_codon:yes gene_type:complete
MSILSAIKQQSGSIEDLAKLPQTMIMQMAQKKQILPEMVPVILAKKAEMIDLNLKSKAMQTQPQTQSVMEQIMSQNAQADNPQEMGMMPPAMQVPMQPPMQPQPPQGAADVGIASNPVPPMQMAGGGIIAFADGGDIDEDDDYQEAQDDAETAAMDSQIYEMISQLKIPEKSTNIGILSGYQIPEKAPEKTPEPRQTNNNIKDLINAKANEYKVPADLMYKIASSESGGKANAANPLSSAKGLFQFTDATWVGMGGKPGEQFDPEKNAELGAKFIRQNAEGLKKAFGRDPTYGEIYAANHFGLKGAKDLLSMDPRTPMENAVSSLVLKQNPQLKGHTVGQVMASLNKKTGDGIVSLAHGGQVQHFVKGGSYGDEYAGTMSGFEEDPAALALDQLRIQKLLAQKKEKELQDKQEFLRNSAPQLAQKLPAEVSQGNSPVFQSTDEQMAADQGYRLPSKAALVQEKPSQKLSPAEEEQFNLMNYIKQRQASIDKASMEDKNMALLAAGLGMMAGTSPYAFSNIGAGGLQGVQQLSASQKLRASQEAAMGKLYGSASQAEMQNKLRQDLLGQRKEEGLKVDLDRARDNLREYEKNMNAHLEKKYPTDERRFDKKMAKEYAAELDAFKLNPDYLELYTAAFPSKKGNSGFKLVGTR